MGFSWSSLGASGWLGGAPRIMKVLFERISDEFLNLRFENYWVDLGPIRGLQEVQNGPGETFL